MGGQPLVYRHLASTLLQGIFHVYYTKDDDIKEFRKFAKPNVYCYPDKYILEWRVEYIDHSVTEESIAEILKEKDVEPYDVKRSGDDVLVRYTYTTYDFFDQTELRKREDVPDNIKKRWSDGHMRSPCYTKPTVYMISEIWDRMEKDAQKQITELQKLLRQIYIGRVFESIPHG
jgi:hypothetical protein